MRASTYIVEQTSGSNQWIRSPLYTQKTRPGRIFFSFSSSLLYAQTFLHNKKNVLYNINFKIVFDPPRADGGEEKRNKRKNYNDDDYNKDEDEEQLY